MKNFFTNLLMGGIGVIGWIMSLIFLGVSTVVSFYIGWVFLQWFF